MDRNDICFELLVATHGYVTSLYKRRLRSVGQSVRPLVCPRYQYNVTAAAPAAAAVNGS